MTEIVTCPHCKKRLQLSAEHMGQRVQCPSCETAFSAGELPPPVPVSTTTPAAIKVPTTAIPAMSLDPSPTESKPKSKRDDDDAPLPPRARRRATPIRSKAPSAYRLPVLLAVGAALLLVGGFIFFLNRDRPDHMPPFQFGKHFGNDLNNIPQEWQMPPRTVVPDRVLNADEQKAEAAAFFKHFSAAMLNQNIASERAAYDGKRMLDGLFEQNLLPDAWRGESFQLTQLLRERITTTPLNPIDRWGNFEIKHVRHPQPRELVVVTRHPHATVPGALRFRWWLKHHGERWLIQDLEDIDYGIRLSTLLALTLEPIPNNTGAFPHPHLRTLHEAANGVLTKDNFADAERVLKDVRTDDLARPYVAMHNMMLAFAHVRQKKYQETVAFAEIVAKAQPDMPGNDYVLSLSLSSINRNEEALKHIERARAWIGDDPDICYQVGFTLHNLRRYPEAAAQYRKVLDIQPEHQNALLSLIRIVGTDVKNDDIAARFERLKNPQERFELYANDCWTNRDVSTLEILATVMRRRMPRYAEAEFYYAVAMADRQKVPEALASIQSALKLQLDVQRREYYCVEFARAMVLRDHAFEAYAALPNSVEAFRTLAESMKNAGKTDDLQRLIELHTKANPNDPYLLLYQAEIQLREEKYALADSTFAKAFTKINDLGLADRFRFDRVRARYHTGDLFGAYRDFAPQRMTFQQLAELCWQDKKFDDLVKLIDIHAKNDPAHDQIARYRTRLDFALKRFDEAGKRLKAIAEPDLEKGPGRTLLEDFLFDAVDAGEALEGYRLCPNPALALEVLSNDLLEMNQPKVLDAILEEHRKNHPKDPLLYMLLGEQAAGRKDWAKAAQAFKEGWSGTPEDKRQRWSYAYLHARFKLGQAIQVHQETGKRLDYFRQLASIILNDKNVDLFEKLLASHRVLGAKEPELAAYEGRLQILRGKPDDAAQGMTAYLKDLPLAEQRRIGDSFLNDLGNFDVAVEAYRCMPNKVDAFSQMTWKYRTLDRAKELERVILEHAKHHPDDPRLASERAELHMLRGEFAMAETQFLLARSKEQARNLNTGRFGLIRARVKLGKAALTYHELGKNTLAFLDIANECVAQKNAEQLDRLLVAHREAFPKATNMAVWDADLLWVKKDYEKTIEAIRADNSALLKSNQYKWKSESFLIRSLVRLNKSKEAVREAEKMNQRKHGPQVLLALALASTGDVKRTVTYLETAIGNRYLIEDSYHDEDLGPILRGEAYRDLHQRFPPPPPRPKAP